MTTNSIPITTDNKSEVAQELVTQIPHYGLAWAIYIGLTLLMVAIIWYGIRKWHFVIKWFFASVVFAGALTPAHPSDGIETYSPLVLNAVVNLFDGYQAQFMGEVKTLCIVWAIIFATGLLLWFVIRKLKNKQPEQKQKIDTEAVMASPIEPKIEDY